MSLGDYAAEKSISANRFISEACVVVTSQHQARPKAFAVLSLCLAGALWNVVVILRSETETNSAL